MGTKVYVGNLAYSVDDAKLKEAFSEYGEISEATVVKDKFSGRSKGFGFVTFADEASAQKAIAEMVCQTYRCRWHKADDAVV